MIETDFAFLLCYKTRSIWTLVLVAVRSAGPSIFLNWGSCGRKVVVVEVVVVVVVGGGGIGVEMGNATRLVGPSGDE